MGNSYRGQGALEFLMTYSWAILLVMVVGLGIWRIGLLSQADSQITAMGFTYFRLVPSESGSSDGHTHLVFQSRVPNSMEISVGKGSFERLF